MLVLNPASGFNTGLVYATLNPNDKGATCTLSVQNLTGAFAVGARALARATMPVLRPSYWEVTVNESGQRGFLGVCTAGVATSGVDPTSDANTYMLWTFDGTYKAGVHQDTLAAKNSGANIGIAYDPIAATLKFYESSAQIGTTMTSVPSGLFPVVGTQSAGVAANLTVNFGHTAFSQTVPAGLGQGVVA